MKFEVADPILSKTAMQKLLRLVLLHHSDSLFAYLCRSMAAPEATVVVELVACVAPQRRLLRERDGAIGQCTFAAIGPMCQSLLKSKTITCAAIVE